MAIPSPSDPFLEVQSDVLSTLSETRSLFSSYLRIRTLAKPQSEELVQARTDLETNLATLSADLQDLLDSIAAVEDDPYAFGIDTAEVQRRRGFVRNVGDEVEGMRKELEGVAEQNVAVGTQQGQGKGKGRLPPPTAFDEANGDGDEDNYAAFEQEQQQTMMAEQDEQLDGVFRSVGVLRGQAEDMGRELEEQGGMLEDVDTLADRVGGKLQVGVKKVGEVIRKNEDSVSSCCIGVLIVVLVILLILVVVI